MIPISVCMIAGSEAARIRRTLESVAGWAAEIVIVINDDVTDGTEKIAAEFGAKVFRETWKGFGPQKQSAAKKCMQPWLLNLDADEEVTPVLRDEIRRALAEPGDYAAFCFPRCTQFCGRRIRHGDWYPDRQTRLWRRGRARWSDVQVHETLKADGPVGRLRHDLLHYTAETINHQIAKTVRYADDFVRHCAEQGKTATFLDLLVRPLWRFWRAYLFKLGFLDGWQGCYIAWMTAFYTATRYAKVRAAQEQKDKPG